MLVGLPAAGELDDAVMWSEPFDASIAQTAMARVDRIHALTTTLGPAAFTVTNGALALVGAGHLATPQGNPGEPAIGTDGHGCRFCPWLKAGSTDPATGCPGAAGDDDAPSATGPHRMTLFSTGSPAPRSASATLLIACTAAPHKPPPAARRTGQPATQERRRIT
jgi:hypothetical protein